MLQSTAEAAICSIGLGFNVVTDVWLKYCKQRGSTDPWLIDLDHAEVQDIVLPGGLTVAGITRSIKCGKRERMRFRSDVLSFQRMSGSSTYEALIVPFGDTCALVSVPFSSLGMASTFAKIEYFIQMVWIGAGSDNMYYQQIGKCTSTTIYVVSAAFVYPQIRIRIMYTNDWR